MNAVQISEIYKLILCTNTILNYRIKLKSSSILGNETQKKETNGIRSKIRSSIAATEWLHQFGDQVIGIYYIQ